MHRCSTTAVSAKDLHGVLVVLSSKFKCPQEFLRTLFDFLDNKDHVVPMTKEVINGFRDSPSSKADDDDNVTALIHAIKDIIRHQKTRMYP